MTTFKKQTAIAVILVLALVIGFAPSNMTPTAHAAAGDPEPNIPPGQSAKYLDDDIVFEYTLVRDADGTKHATLGWNMAWRNFVNVEDNYDVPKEYRGYPVTRIELPFIRVGERSDWGNSVTFQVSDINLAQCTELEYLNLKSSALKKLNLRGNPKLRYLDVSSSSGYLSYSLTKLDLSNNSALEYVNCKLNRITKFTPGLPELKARIKTFIYDPQARMEYAVIKGVKKTYPHTGKVIKPAWKAYINGVEVDTRDTGDFAECSAKFGKNTGIGYGYVEVRGTYRGKGNSYYPGTKRITFKIVPTKLKKISAKKTGARSATVKWAKSPRKERVTGYQVSYKNTKSKVWSSKNISTKKTSTKLKFKKGGTYQMKVRSYKRVGKELFYGFYSTGRRVKM